MIVEEFIYKLLTESPEVVAVVGDNIFPNHAPPGAGRPCIIFYQYSYWEDENAQEFGQADAQHGFQFEILPNSDIHSENYIAGKRLAALVRQAFRGTNMTVDDLCILKIRSVEQKDSWLPQIESHAVQSAYIFHETIGV